MLASRTDVVSTQETGSGRWFPYAQLTFTHVAHGDAIGE
jgi:hypothetical protein